MYSKIDNNEQTLVDSDSIKKPDTLSVIVIAICSATYLDRCIDALKRQTGVNEFEIIVVYDKRLEDIPLLNRKFPDVMMYTIKNMSTPEELATLGIRKAGGDIIALTEDHCIPEEDWCSNILKAHESPYAAVGGAINCVTENKIDWAFAFCDYYRYLTPVPEGKSLYLTVCNVAYKRRALEKVVRAWGDKFHEVTVNNALLNEGETLWLSQKLMVKQNRKVSFFNALRERYSFGWLFGSTRAVSIDPQLRLLYFVAAPAIPFVLMSRMWKNIVLRRTSFAIFIRAFPAIFSFTIAITFGEFLGNIAGRIPSEVYVAR